MRMIPVLLTTPLLIYSFFVIHTTPETLATHNTSSFDSSYRPAKPRPSVRYRISPTPALTATPTPTPKPLPKTTKTNTPITSSPNQSVKDYIMNAINDYRKSQGLYAVTTDSNTCNFAKMRAQEIATNFTHDGFRNRIDSKTLPYPGYKSVTENIAKTSDYKRVVTLWINSPGHAENMRKDTPFVCVEQSGDYYAYEGWRP